MKISESVALVTGGASGLGEATVRRFVADGGKAVIVDMNAESHALHTRLAEHMGEGH